MTPVRGASMFEEKDALPRSELHLSVGDRYGFTGPRQDHANVRRHVIAPFLIVFVIRVFRNELIKKPFQIAPGRRCRIFHHDNAATGVLHKNGNNSVLNSVFGDAVLDLVRDFASAFAICLDDELVMQQLHGTETLIDIPGVTMVEKFWPSRSRRKRTFAVKSEVGW